MKALLQAVLVIAGIIVFIFWAIVQLASEVRR